MKEDFIDELVSKCEPKIQKEFRKVTHALTQLSRFEYGYDSAYYHLVGQSAFAEIFEIPGWFRPGLNSQFFLSNFMFERTDTDEPSQWVKDSYSDYIASLDLISRLRPDMGLFRSQVVELSVSERSSITKSLSARAVLLALVAAEEGFLGPFSSAISMALYKDRSQFPKFLDSIGASSSEKSIFRILIGHTKFLGDETITQTILCDFSGCSHEAGHLITCPSCDTSEFICSKHLSSLRESALAPDVRFSATCGHEVLDYRACHISRLPPINF